MLRETMWVIAAALTVFVWMSATIAPAASALRSLFSRRAGAWAAFALACAGACVWTIVLAGASFIVLSCDPRLAASVLAVPFTVRDGLLLGVALWLLATAVRREAPRLGEHVEIATALAVVALVRDDERTLSRVEALYRQHVVRPMRPSVHSIRIARAQV